MRWRVLRVLGWLLFASALLLFAVGCGGTIAGFVDSRRVDLRRECAAGSVDRCFEFATGVVESVDGDHVRVSYDDGVRTTKLTLAADSAPAAGTRVRLERWEDYWVSLYDPARERRYHTMWWPRPWDPYGLGIMGFAIVVMALALVPVYLARRATAHEPPEASLL